MCYKFVRGKNDQPDYFGATCLHIAAGRGQLQTVKYLTEFGANIVALDNNQRSPMDEAFMSDHHDIVEYLDHTIASKTSNAIKQLQKKAMKAHTKSLKETLKRDHRGFSEIFKPLKASKSTETLLATSDGERRRSNPQITKSKSLDDLVSGAESTASKAFDIRGKSHPNTIRVTHRSHKQQHQDVKKHEGLLHREGFGEICNRYRPHYIKNQQYAAGVGRPGSLNKPVVFADSALDEEDDLTVIRVLSSEESLTSDDQHTNHKLSTDIQEFLMSHDLKSLQFFFDREKITLNELKYVERSDLRFSGVPEQVIDKFFKAVSIHQIKKAHSSYPHTGSEDNDSLDTKSMIIHDHADDYFAYGKDDSSKSGIENQHHGQTKRSAVNMNNNVRFKTMVEEIQEPAIHINEADETTRL